MRIAVLIGAVIVCLLFIATQSAYACPSGTVFSAYKGNGICAYEGQGATKAVQCTQMVNSCPSGTSREQKKSDKHVYCCPKTIVNGQAKVCVWRGTPPFCEGSCGAFEENRGSARDIGSADRNPSAKGWSNLFGKSCVSGSKALCCHYKGS
jgi:hypothetical protein